MLIDIALDLLSQATAVSEHDRIHRRNRQARQASSRPSVWRWSWVSLLVAGLGHLPK
jgi:hypothetical protein